MSGRCGYLLQMVYPLERKSQFASYTPGSMGVRAGGGGSRIRTLLYATLFYCGDQYPVPGSRSVNLFPPRDPLFFFRPSALWRHLVDLIFYLSLRD